MALISLQSTNGKSCVADANVEWDKTILPSLAFTSAPPTIGPAKTWLTTIQTLMGDRTLPSDQSRIRVAAERQGQTHGFVGR